MSAHVGGSVHVGGAHMLCAFGRQQSASSIILQELVTLVLLLACVGVVCHDSGMEVRGQLSVSYRHVGSQACRKCLALPVTVPLSFVWRQSLIVELTE